jgi:hypothetical protein
MLTAFKISHTRRASTCRNAELLSSLLLLAERAQNLILPRLFKRKFLCNATGLVNLQPNVRALPPYRLHARNRWEHSGHTVTGNKRSTQVNGQVSVSLFSPLFSWLL